MDEVFWWENDVVDNECQERQVVPSFHIPRLAFSLSYLLLWHHLMHRICRSLNAESRKEDKNRHFVVYYQKNRSCPCGAPGEILSRHKSFDRVCPCGPSSWHSLPSVKVPDMASLLKVTPSRQAWEKCLLTRCCPAKLKLLCVS